MEEEQYCDTCAHGMFLGDGTVELICLLDEKVDLSKPTGDSQYCEATKRAYDSVCDCGKYEPHPNLVEEDERENKIAEIIKAEHCENCMMGMPVQDIGVYCMANDRDDLPNDWELPELSRPGDPVCNCGKYEFDEDMRESIEYNLCNPVEVQYFTNWIEKSFSFIPISKYFSLNV